MCRPGVQKDLCHAFWSSIKNEDSETFLRHLLFLSFQQQVAALKAKLCLLSLYMMFRRARGRSTSISHISYADLYAVSTLEQNYRLSNLYRMVCFELFARTVLPDSYLHKTWPLFLRHWLCFQNKIFCGCFARDLFPELSQVTWNVLLLWV